jgi:hypothetical protein
MTSTRLLADGAGQAANATLLLLGAAFIGWLAVRAIRRKALLRVPLAVAWAGLAAAVALAALALLLPSLVSPAPSAARPSSTATIHIVSPTDDQVFKGTADAPAHVLVKIRVLGARIVPLTSRRLRPDEGHVHLFLDGSLVSMTAGTAASLDAGPGTHVLGAEFVASDHGPFDPRVQATVRFVVRPGG